MVVQELAVSRALGIGLTAIWRPLLGYLGLSLAMAGCIGVVAIVLPGTWPPVIRLVVLVLVGAIAYVGIGWAVARRLVRPVLTDARSILLGR